MKTIIIIFYHLIIIYRIVKFQISINLEKHFGNPHYVTVRGSSGYNEINLQYLNRPFNRLGLIIYSPVYVIIQPIKRFQWKNGSASEIIIQSIFFKHLCELGLKKAFDILLIYVPGPQK